MSDRVTVTEQPIQVTVVAGDPVQITEQPIEVTVSEDGSVTVLEQPITVTVETGEVVQVTETPIAVTVGGADHPSTHPLTGADHALSGLTIGHVLTATAADAAAFQPGGGGHSQAHAISGADHTGVISATQHGTPAGDLHTPYALLAGRAGGQTFSGGTLAGQHVTIRANPVDGGGGAGRIVLTSQVRVDSGIIRDWADSARVTFGATETAFQNANTYSFAPIAPANITQFRADATPIWSFYTAGGDTARLGLDVGSVGLQDVTLFRPGYYGGATGVNAWRLGTAENRSLLPLMIGADVAPAAGVMAEIRNGTVRHQIAAVGILYQGFVAAEANPRARLQTNMIEFGGGAAAPDTWMARESTAGFTMRRTQTTQAPTLRGMSSSDTQPRWSIGGVSTQGFQMGAGGSAALDTHFRRVEAGVWEVTDVLELVTRAGNPTTPINYPRLFVKGSTPAGGTDVPRHYTIDGVGRVFGPLGTMRGVFSPHGMVGSMGGFGVGGIVTDINSYGLLANPTKVLNGGTESKSYQTIDHNFFYEQTTAAVIDADVGFEWGKHVSGEGPVSLSYLFRIDSAANIRLFIGYTNQTLATMLGADNPAGVYFGLQFSTARADTNWQWVEKGVGGTQVLTDSGVAAGTTAGFLISLYQSGSVCLSQLFGFDSTPLGSEVMLNTDMPGTTEELRLVAGLRPLAAASKMLSHSFASEVMAV